MSVFKKNDLYSNGGEGGVESGNGGGGSHGYGTTSKEEVLSKSVDHGTTNKWYRTVMTNSSSFVLLFVVAIVVGSIGCVAVNNHWQWKSLLSSSSSTAAFSTLAVEGTASSVGIVGDEECCPTSKYYISSTFTGQSGKQYYGLICIEYHFTDQASMDLAVEILQKEDTTDELVGVLCSEIQYFDEPTSYGPYCHPPGLDNVCYQQIYFHEQK